MKTPHPEKTLICKACRDLSSARAEHKNSRCIDCTGLAKGEYMFLLVSLWAAHCDLQTKYNKLTDQVKDLTHRILTHDNTLIEDRFEYESKRG